MLVSIQLFQKLGKLLFILKSRFYTTFGDCFSDTTNSVKDDAKMHKVVHPNPETNSLFSFFLE